MTVTIWHNPRCSKSREALQLLQERGITPEVVKYLESPPTAEALAAVIDALGVSPRQLMRCKEKEYKENHLDDPSLSREALIEAMVRFPRLIERPLVLKGGKAVLGRPPVKVLEIL